jgi:hypothetical protein
MGVVDGLTIVGKSQVFMSLVEMVGFMDYDVPFPPGLSRVAVSNHRIEAAATNSFQPFQSFFSHALHFRRQLTAETAATAASCSEAPHLLHLFPLYFSYAVHLGRRWRPCLQVLKCSLGVLECAFRQGVNKGMQVRTVRSRIISLRTETRALPIERRR